MNTKVSVFAICIEAIMYLLLYNLYDCTFKKVISAGKDNDKLHILCALMMIRNREIP